MINKHNPIIEDIRKTNKNSTPRFSIFDFIAGIVLGILIGATIHSIYFVNKYNHEIKAIEKWNEFKNEQ